jgi:prepilin-type N-terminal cleavage/methylation domain-containing protein
MSHQWRETAGFTLVELIVTLAILAIATSVATGALTSVASGSDDPSGWVARLSAARARAIETGVPTLVSHDSAHVVPPVLYLPDGRAVGLDEGTDSLVMRAR